MRFMRLASVATLTAASSAAMAGGFDGPFVQGGVGFARSQTEARSHWPTPPDVDSKPSDNSFIGQIAGGYSRSFGQFNLAASAFYVLGDQNAGDIAVRDAGNPDNTYRFKNKNSWGISIEPGFNFNESTLAYLKLAYVESQGRGVEQFRGVSYSYNATYHGYGYGAGVKYKFTPNLYGVADIQQANYQSRSFENGGLNLKPNSLTGIIGVGYKF